MGCFSSAGTVPLVRINGIIDKKVYNNLLNFYANPTLIKCKLRIFQHNMIRSIQQKSVKQNLAGKRLPAKVMEWPSQSPDMNPIEKFVGLT